MQRDGGPGGAGGAGNPVGGSFTGPAEALELVGDHCFAYSGAVPISDTNTHKLLSFTTGNYYSVVEFIFWRRSWEDDDIAFYIEMNGTQVLAWIGRVAEPQGTNQQLMVIPSYTEIAAYADKQAHANASIVGINITGRIYRG